MKLYHKQFLGIDPEFTSFEQAAVVVLPCPYEGGVSYGVGTAHAPQAIIDASYYVELYDEVLDYEPYRIGISTLEQLVLPKSAEGMIESVYKTTKSLIQQNKLVALLGGDHSITTGYVRALKEKYNQLSVIQFDAHADLRDSYENSIYSHACTMSRIRELTPYTLQLGIRSLSVEEATLIKQDAIPVMMMHQFRSNSLNFKQFLEQLPDPVFITFDVDVFDWSVVSSTGTPEPGGFFWDEVLKLLEAIFKSKNVIGFDIVELSYRENDNNSPFAIAKLIYKMIGYKFFNIKNSGNL
jgi:agmatinase